MKSLTAWILRIVPAFIMGQTLPFKFLGATESKVLFTTLTEKALGNGNYEALARLGTGTIELLAVVLLLTPKFSSKGAIFTTAIMAGALMSHALFLGFSGANGQLAAMASVAMICSLIYLAKTFNMSQLSQQSGKAKKGDLLHRPSLSIK